jgi:hypothetical protein
MRFTPSPPKGKTFDGESGAIPETGSWLFRILKVSAVQEGINCNGDVPARNPAMRDQYK